MTNMKDIVDAFKKKLEAGMPIQVDDYPYNLKLEKDGLYLETQLGTMKWTVVSFEDKKEDKLLSMDNLRQAEKKMLEVLDEHKLHPEFEYVRNIYKIRQECPSSVPTRVTGWILEIMDKYGELISMKVNDLTIVKVYNKDEWDDFIQQKRIKIVNPTLRQSKPESEISTIPAVVAQDIAVCVFGDQFSRKKGRVIALARVIRQLKGEVK